MIYNIQNTQIWVITQEQIFTFHYHRKINFHLKVSEAILGYILCPKMQNFWIGQFLDLLDIKFLQIEKIVKNGLHVIKCHHPTIFNCSNEKLSKNHVFKPIFHKKGNIKVNIFMIMQ